METLFICFISSLMIIALHVSLKEDMILSKLRKPLFYLPSWAHKPVYDCLPCMGGIYGIATYFLFYGFEFDLKLMFVHILTVIGINVILENYVDKYE